MGWTGEAQGFASVELKEIDGLGDIRIGFGPVFADFVGEPGGELELAVADDGGRVEKQRNPCIDRGPAPGLESLKSGGHGLLSVLGSRFLVHADDLGGAGGVQRVDLVGGFEAVAADDQFIFTAKLPAIISRAACILRVLSGALKSTKGSLENPP